MKYAIDGLTEQYVIDAIESTPVKKLIYELNFKFGLKVLALEQKGEMYTRRPQEIVLTDATGTFVVARAWTEDTGKNLTYYFRSPYFIKDRGHSREDKETFFSKKLSTLIATIKRNSIIPNEEQILHFYRASFFSAVHTLESSHGRSYKDDALSVDKVHTLLKYALGETTELNILAECKTILDKYNKLDKIKETAKADIKRFFGGGFYAIGADGFGQLVVGKIKHIGDDVSGFKFNVVEPFVRVKNLDKHEHLQPIMLMQKVYHEQQGRHTIYHANLIPPHSGLLNDLDIIQINNAHPSVYDFVWTFVPCLPTL